MLKDIIKKEILDHLLSSKFVVMFIICSALILLSVYMGVGEYLADKKVYDDDIAWDAMGMAPPNTYGTLLEGMLKTYRAPQTLGAVAKGVENAAGRASHVILTEVGLSESKYETNPLAAVFGAFDLLFIVKMVLSLFAILLIYDTICGEREKGTLKLALSNNIPRDRLLLGKAVGGYISLIIPLLVPVLLSLIYLSLHPDIALAGEEWQRIGFIFLMFLLYLSVFFCLGLLVSSLTARSSTSLIVLLFVWSVWGLVVPKASVIIAGMLRPVPVATEVYNQKISSSNQLSQELNQSIPQKQQELVAQLNEQINAAPMEQRQELVQKLSGEFNKLIQELQSDLERRQREAEVKIDRDYQMRKDAQAALAKNISRVSPASAVTFSVTTLARTGIDDYNRFVKAALDYKPVITGWIRTNPDLRDERGSYKQVDPDTIAGRPQAVIEYENLSQSFVRIFPDLVSMIVMIALLTGGAYFAFIRCDVR